MTEKLNAEDLPATNHERSSVERASSVPVLSQFYRANSINKLKPLRAAIYARVSTQEQAQKKTSIPAQIELCQNTIGLRKWEFIAEYSDEGVSGHLTEERHGLQSLLRDARLHKFDVIIVKDYDRFARNKDAAGIIRQELKHLAIQIFAINTPVEPSGIADYDADRDQIGTMVEAMADMKSDLDRKGIILRMKDGKTNRAKAGHIPNRVPYGYKVTRTPNENSTKFIRTIVVDEEQANHVRYMYENYARGTGDRKLVLEMNARGWKPSRGTRWSISAVRYILANPTYIGKVWWGWRHADSEITREWKRRGKLGYIGDGTHAKIVDEQLYNVVQQVRAGRNKSFKGGATFSRGLLTGIAKCIRCGTGVGYQKRFHNRSKKNPNWRDTYTNEYICTGYKYRGICSPRVMSAQKLEGEVISRIKELYMHPKVQEGIVYNGKDADSNDRERELARLSREIAMQDDKLLRQHEAYERGIISIEAYEAAVQRIKEQTESYHTEHVRLSALQHLAAQRSTAAQKLVASLRDFDHLWGAMELDEKKMILRSIIKEIRAGDGRIEVDFIL